MDIDKLLDTIPNNGGYFSTAQPGDYVCRIVSEVLSYVKAPFVAGQGNGVGFVCRVIDRKDGVIRVWTFSPAIMRCIATLAKDSDYGFTGLPNYDLKINRVGVSTDTKWSILPKPEASLTPDEVKMVADLQAEKPLSDVHRGLVERETKKMNGGVAPIANDEIKVDDIPM